MLELQYHLYQLKGTFANVELVIGEPPVPSFWSQLKIAAFIWYYMYMYMYITYSVYMKCTVNLYIVHVHEELYRVYYNNNNHHHYY